MREEGKKQCTARIWMRREGLNDEEIRRGDRIGIERAALDAESSGVTTSVTILVNHCQWQRKTTANFVTI